jgi:hypothetical protein
MNGPHPMGSPAPGPAANPLMAPPGPDGPDLILVFGGGLGYHIEALRNKWPDARLVVFEPRSRLKSAFDKARLSLNHGGSWWRLIETWNDFNDFLTQNVVLGDHPRPGVFVCPGYRDLFGPRVDDFEAMIRGAQVRRAVNDKTNRLLGRRFAENTAHNLNAALTRPNAAAVRDTLAGRAGFIVGSGPSLEKNGALLAKAQGKGLILAAGSALAPLLDMGVRPDVAVVIEADDTSDYLARAEEAPGLVVTIASAAHPAHFRVPAAHQAIYHLNHGAAYLFDAETFVPQAGTAGSAAFTLGLLWGLNPLVLVGQDQAFETGAVHAPGTPGEVALDRSMTRYGVAGVGGTDVATHSGFAAALHWYAESARYLARTNPALGLVNATEGGARIPGFEDMTLQAALDRLPDADPLDPPLSRRLEAVQRPDPKRVARRIERSWRFISDFLSLIRFDPAQAAEFLGECQSQHPVVKAWLAGLSPDDPSDRIKERFIEAENHLLAMLEALN